MSFLVGDNGKTQAEFTINVDSRDFYDLNIIDGFDIGTQISSDNGPSLTCTDANCPDAYRNPTDNSQVSPVGSNWRRRLFTGWRCTHWRHFHHHLLPLNNRRPLINVLLNYLSLLLQECDLYPREEYPVNQATTENNTLIDIYYFLTRDRRAII